MRHTSVFFFALLLLFLWPGGAQAALPDMPPEGSGTLAGDWGSLSVSAGAKYLKPQRFRGGPEALDDVGFISQGGSDTGFSKGFFGSSVSLAGEKTTDLSLLGLRDIRLTGSFGHSAGRASRSHEEYVPAGLLWMSILSIDPGDTLTPYIVDLTLPPFPTVIERIELSLETFDLAFGLEGRGRGWGGGEGVRVWPVFGAGLTASTQRYQVKTSVANLTFPGVNEKVREVIRTSDLGPELRAGLAAELPSGLSLSATGSVALLATWAQLDASQVIFDITTLKHSANDFFMAGRLGLALRADCAVTPALTLGLEGTGRYWTWRPTVENPRPAPGVTITAPYSSSGVRIGHATAAEAGLALRLSYAF